MTHPAFVATHAIAALNEAINEARAGLTVLFVSPTAVRSNDAHRLAADASERDASKITRTSGRQEIRFPNGGRIRFLSKSTRHAGDVGLGRLPLLRGVRGLTIDVAYIQWQDEYDQRFMRALLPTFATRGESRVVTYL